MHLAAVVLRNLLEAHVLVYAALKAMPGGAAAQIGLVKDIFQVGALTSSRGACARRAAAPLNPRSAPRPAMPLCPFALNPPPPPPPPSQFEPYNAYSPLDTAAASIVDSIMNESILRFLRTGHFSFWMPGQASAARGTAVQPSGTAVQPSGTRLHPCRDVRTAGNRAHLAARGCSP